MKPDLTRRVVLHAKFRAKALLGVKGTCKFGPFSIVLPKDHVLPRSLKEHPRYDRFLPYLSRSLPQGSTVIDVGANCGDTLASMLATNQSLSFACVEADDTFFKYLEQNIERIRNVNPSVNVRAIKALVGKEVTSASLESSKGTAHASFNGASQSKSAKTLDDIARESSLHNVSLLKSDVDGFDYDVLNSAEALIREQKPLVFFECYVENARQRAGFKNTLGTLQANGYSDWAIFDNYGELMLRTTSVEQIEQLLDYCWNVTNGRSTRTLNYFDILGSTPRDKALIDKVVNGYTLADNSELAIP